MKTYKVDTTKKDDDLLKDYIRVIKKLHKDLAEYIIKSGIQKTKYDFLIKNLDKKPIEHIFKIYIFLIELKDNEYREVKRAFNLVPDHVWKTYETIFNTTDMPEQEHLEKCRKAVKKKWLERPKEKGIKKENIKKEEI